MGFIVFEEEAFCYLDAQLENFVKRMDRIRERSEDNAMSQCLKSSKEEIALAVEGCFTEHHKFMIRAIRTSISNIEAKIVAASTRMKFPDHPVVLKHKRLTDSRI